MSRRRTLALAAAFAAGALVLAGCTADGDVGEQVANQGYVSGDGSTRQWAVAERGEPVTLTGTDYAGDPVDTSAWRGDVVVVNTWFAACPPCRVEAPDLAAIAADRAADGVHLVGINRTDDAGAAQAFEKKFEIPYPTIDDREGTATAALQGVAPIAATPTTLVLDRQGRVAARVLGLLDRTTLDALIDDVLAEQA
ncbi:TlpA disulfide reductase family protein [Sanguibacter sp. HDW7]|uniref:TlpA family protein disulfide reductase n=1 Tax=Sanguibacter sp. HDW7 TaxID=2714931 RepID=UPI001F0D842B|nr:TlpA disulfide reductase family protein [Sanguibacter sp. HDW7]